MPSLVLFALKARNEMESSKSVSVISLFYNRIMIIQTLAMQHLFFLDIPSTPQISDYHLFLKHFRTDFVEGEPFHRSNHFHLLQQVVHHICQSEQLLLCCNEFPKVPKKLKITDKCFLLNSLVKKIHKHPYIFQKTAGAYSY